MPAQIGHNAPPPLEEILAENYAGLAADVESLATKANAMPKAVKNDGDLDMVAKVVKDAKALGKKIDEARKAEKEPHLAAGRTVDAHFKAMTERVDRITKALADRASDYQRQKIAEERARQEEAARKAREKEEAARRKAKEAAEKGKAAQAARAEVQAELAAEKAAEAERQADQSNADLARQRTASGTVVGARTTKKVRIVDMAALGLGPLGPYLDREAVQKAANAWLKFTKGAETLPGLEVYDDVQASFR